MLHSSRDDAWRSTGLRGRISAADPSKDHQATLPKTTTTAEEKGPEITRQLPALQFCLKGNLACPFLNGPLDLPYSRIFPWPSSPPSCGSERRARTTLTWGTWPTPLTGAPRILKFLSLGFERSTSSRDSWASRWFPSSLAEGFTCGSRGLSPNSSQ